MAIKMFEDYVNIFGKKIYVFVHKNFDVYIVKSLLNVMKQYFFDVMTLAIFFGSIDAARVGLVHRLVWRLHQCLIPPDILVRQRLYCW